MTGSGEKPVNQVRYAAYLDRDLKYLYLLLNLGGTIL